jgi:hypothetical protein
MTDIPEIPEEDEIPLLEDVVTPEELDKESEYIVFEDKDSEEFTAATSEYDEVLLAMRKDILAQLQADLRPLVLRSLEQAIDEALERATRILHKELTQPLEKRLLNLIEERMEEEFGPQQHPDKGKDEDKSP